MMTPPIPPRPSPPRRARAAGGRPGQALVEVALATPIILLLLCAMWAGFVLLRASIGLESAAFEAARAGALADSELAAQADGAARGQNAAALWGIGPVQQLSVTVTLPDGFARGATVQAVAGARVRLSDVPFFGWAEVRMARQARERIDRWRSLRPAQ
jgi:Flp pilus assembly protein TadG